MTTHYRYLRIHSLIPSESHQSDLGTGSTPNREVGADWVFHLRAEEQRRCGSSGLLSTQQIQWLRMSWTRILHCV